MKQYLFNRFMGDISKMLNVVKPTQSIVFAQPPFKGWMMPVSKFGTSCTCLDTTMSRLWGLTTAIARLHRKSCGRYFLWTYRSIQTQQFTGIDFSDCDYDYSRLRSVYFSNCYTCSLINAIVTFSVIWIYVQLNFL